MKSNFSKLLIVPLIICLMFPSLVFAAWYNPFSWPWGNIGSAISSTVSSWMGLNQVNTNPPSVNDHAESPSQPSTVYTRTPQTGGATTDPGLKHEAPNSYDDISGGAPTSNVDSDNVEATSQLYTSTEGGFSFYPPAGWSTTVPSVKAFVTEQFPPPQPRTLEFWSPLKTPANYGPEHVGMTIEFTDIYPMTPSEFDKTPDIDIGVTGCTLVSRNTKDINGMKAKESLWRCPPEASPPYLRLDIRLLGNNGQYYGFGYSGPEEFGIDEVMAAINTFKTISQ